MYDIPPGHYLKHVVGCLCVGKYIGIIYNYSCSFVFRGLCSGGQEQGHRRGGSYSTAFQAVLLFQ